MDGAPAPDSVVASESVTAPIDPGPIDPGIAAPEPVIEAPPEPELDEIEYDGEKFKVPRKLKDGFLMQSDYTRKTQEVAEQRKAVEAEKAAVAERAKASEEHTRDMGRMLVLSDQLAEFDKIDWQKLGQDDPFKADELFRQRTLLKEQRDGLARQIQTNEWKRTQETQQSFAKRYEETNQTLAKDIKGWNQELANKLRDFAVANGASDDDIKMLAVNAPLVKLLHKAFQGDQLISKQQTAAQSAEPKIAPKPLTTVSGSGAKPAVNLADADMESYVAERKKQGYGKR
jgi:hypothetical protein